MSFVAKRLMACAETGCTGSAGIEKERSYVRPSMAWDLWIAKLSVTPGSGSVGFGDGVLFAVHPDSNMSKNHRDTKTRRADFTIVHSKTTAPGPRRAERHLPDSFGAHRRRIRGRHRRIRH